MEIVAGIRAAGEAAAVVSAGAGQVYCGVFDPDWEVRFPNACPAINRRPYYRDCNLSSMQEAAEAARIVHGGGAELALTVNEHFYTDAQLPLLDAVIGEADAAGVDALIVSDLGLISLLAERGWRGRLHISTTASVYNAGAARFLFGMGARRIILPRHLTPAEMAVIAAEASGEYEAFIMNSGCYFDDGLCGFEHALQFFSGHGAGGCALAWSVSGPGQAPEGYHGPAGRALACGACAVPALQRAGLSALKIVSREFDLAKKVKDILFVRRLVELAAAGGITDEDYQREARRLYRAFSGGPCVAAQCYY